MKPPSEAVLIVGGARGIGRATVDRLNALGLGTLVWDHDQAALEDLTGVQEKRRLDITDRRGVTAALDELSARGPLKGVVITAGVHSTHPAAVMPDQVLDRVMEVNFTAHAKLARDVIPLLAPGGRLIGVSSIAATVGIPMSAAYSASKAALELFYETLWIELRPQNLWPIIVQPGNVNTGFNETGNDFAGMADPGLLADYRRVVESIHSRHGMPPDEVAKVITVALTASRPKCFYVVGSNALKAVLAKRILGRQGALFMLRRHFGLSG